MCFFLYLFYDDDDGDIKYSDKYELSEYYQKLTNI
jgi:hypothetical protein